MGNPERNQTFWNRFKKGLQRTHQAFSEGLGKVFAGKNSIDDHLLEQLEEFLITADVGLALSRDILQQVKVALKKEGITDIAGVETLLKQVLTQLLITCQRPLEISATKPFVVLVVGVNGAGKTTTIGKLAKKLQSEGKTLLLAAGDTFRAAAIEQLKVWGEKNQVSVIAQQPGADSASVIFDALQAAKAKKVDVLMADTAGRLPSQENLMEELKKVSRILRKLDAEAPHEILLVLDAGIGQNALLQAKKFHEALGVTGIVLTKLDGTSKGGIIFNIAKTLQIPIRFIGMGEGIEDLRTFEAAPFVEALFSKFSDE